MLRALISLCTRYAVLAAALSATAAVADDTPDAVVDYAPGSTGRITAPLATIVDNAKRRGDALRDMLRPQAAPESAFSGVDFKGLRDRALSDPRVRALLGADDIPGPGAGDGEAEDGPRYDGATIFLLASFSMPKPALRQMMEEAKTYGLPIVFRGFVNNSVYDTQAALQETFGSLEAAAGFSIDPTLFTRLEVTSVPQVIALGAAVDVCATPGCEEDPVPPHDRVGGNVPLSFALQRIADFGDVGAGAARKLLAGKRP